MLRYRLIFGILMILFFVGLVLADAWLDGSFYSGDHKTPLQATGLVAVILLLAVLAQFELGVLIKQTGATPFYVVTIPATMLLATYPYWLRLLGLYTEAITPYLVPFLFAMTLLSLLFYQARKFGAEKTVVNCSANYMGFIYLGLLSAFCLAIRIDYGPWAFLMFIFTVKSADTGAYAAGRLFGKHKFSPRISPGKTWEGIAGALVGGAAVAIAFCTSCGIMCFWWGLLFGVVFAFLGQLADLAESLIKRDARQKDSSGLVPGFGGLLDVLDSPLGTAPLAYMFFSMIGRG